MMTHIEVEHMYVTWIKQSDSIETITSIIAVKGGHIEHLNIQCRTIMFNTGFPHVLESP